LGKWIPVAETNPKSLDYDHDPYVLHRQIRHKLYRAVDEENQLNEQLLSLQTRCQQYETVIVQAIQKAVKDYTDQITKESQYSTTVANETNGPPQPPHPNPKHLPPTLPFSVEPSLFDAFYLVVADV